MDYRILGPLEVVDGGTTLDVGTRQQRALLALLLVHRNRMVTTDRILEELWPDDPLGKERSLWVYISRLRTILEPDRAPNAKSTTLLTRDRGYSLEIADADVDAGRFEELAREGGRLVRDDPERAARLLTEALDLWRGGALEDFRYDDFARAETIRLDELRLVAIEDRIDADIRNHRHREVIGALEKLVMDHPHRERLVALEMIALYRAGRQADALRAFERHRRLIGDQLGIEPSPELRLIEEQVLLHDPRLSPAPEPGPAPAAPTENPFKGLHAFGEHDVSRFFGRERMVSGLVRRLNRGDRFLALVGASGSGKSSVLRAGLVPAICKGAVAGSESWLVARMVPSSRPFRELEAALLRSSLDAPESLGAVLDDPEDGILRACLRLLSEPHERVMIVIDQFEELFTLVGDAGEQERFIRNLEVVLDDAHGRVAVALGLRADFYGRPLQYPRFAELLAQGIVNVTPLTPDELEAAAHHPAALAGVTLENALVVQLLTDVAGQPGGLPLFQYALTELYERRDGSVLSLDAYREMGGCSGALARRAEDLFLELGPDERRVAKQLFLRLVTVVEQGAWGRRRVAASEIVAIAADVVAIQTVLDAFAKHRLLTFDRDPVSGSPTVEVAHEALLNEWPRLRRWIDEGQRDVLLHARLTAAMAEWTASGEKADYLLVGERLADYERQASVSTLELSSVEQRFLDASIRNREAVVIAEEQRHAREVKRDRQARRRLLGLGVGAVVVTAAIIGSLLLLIGGGHPSVALVHGVADDQGITDLMIAGVGQAELDHDLEIERFPVLVDPEEVLRDVASSGVELIIVGSEYDRQVELVAPDFPDVHWVAIDPVGLHIERPNISEIHFAVEDSAFLAGAAAALTTGTGRIGFIGGYQSFRSERARNGFQQGAVHVDEDIEVVAAFLGPVADPLTRVEARDDLAHELAAAMYADGVDVIFHDAGEAGAGVIRAAAEALGVRAWTIGSDADEYHTVPVTDRGLVLTSTLKRFDKAVTFAVDRFLSGDLEPGDTTLGLGDDGVGLARSGGYLASVESDLVYLEGEIGFDHLAVSPHAETAPDWQTTPDVTIRLALEETECVVDEVIGASFDGERVRVPRDQTVLFQLTNNSTDTGGIAVRTIPTHATLASLRREAEEGIPESFELLLNISLVQLGARTSAAARVDGQPMVPNCIIGDPERPSFDYIPLIVSPS